MDILINEHEQRPRAGWRLLLQFVLMALFVVLLSLAVQLIQPASSSLPVTLANFLGITLSVWIAARYLDKRPLIQYGLRFDRRWRSDFLAGSLIAGIAITCIFLLEWYCGWITVTGYGWQTPSATSFGWALAGAFGAMLLIGFHEELFSRGYQLLNLSEGLRYPRLGSRGAVAVAVLATSSLFGFLHAGNPNASAVSTFNIILAGVTLAVPYVLTGSLALSVGLHFSWNFVQGGIFGFPVSGMNFESSVLQIRQGGADLWTGGAFGPEAGLAGIMGMAIIGTLSCVYIKVTGYELAIAGLFTKEYQPFAKSDEQAS